MMRALHLSLWILIFINFLAALIIFMMPYDFAHSVETLLSRLTPQEEPLLEKEALKQIGPISLTGSPQGNAEIVKPNP